MSEENTHTDEDIERVAQFKLMVDEKIKELVKTQVLELLEKDNSFRNDVLNWLMYNMHYNYNFKQVIVDVVRNAVRQDCGDIRFL